MNAFDLRQKLVIDYGRSARNFISISDADIKAFVDCAFDGGLLWPKPLLHSNSSFKLGRKVTALAAEKVFHPECAKIFRVKTCADLVGTGPLLHTHQSAAIRRFREGKSHVLTSGNGSGKSLADLVRIVDHFLRSSAGRGLQAIVYPMNALRTKVKAQIITTLPVGIIGDDLLLPIPA